MRSGEASEFPRQRNTTCFAAMWSAARACQADIVVRVTADNPFNDPDSIDRVVDRIALEGAEYAIENNLPVGLPAKL